MRIAFIGHSISRAVFPVGVEPGETRMSSADRPDQWDSSLWKTDSIRRLPGPGSTAHCV
jgi:hypothetical protein